MRLSSRQQYKAHHSTVGEPVGVFCYFPFRIHLSKLRKVNVCLYVSGHVLPLHTYSLLLYEVSPYLTSLLCVCVWVGGWVGVGECDSVIV